ncbi:hypothetical protein Tco_1155392 [Tanacetum coccineum]
MYTILRLLKDNVVRKLLEVHVLALGGYYRRFIENFSKIAKPLTELAQNKKEFIWGEEHEKAFETLKHRLCNAATQQSLHYHKDYSDALHKGLMQGNKSLPIISLQHILDQIILNMRQRRWIKLLSDYDCELKYHPGKANVVADTLSRKEKLRPSRVWALGM